MPEIVSLLTCFHFAGFHREHHEQPHVPWWRLPRVTVSLRDHAG
jgi:beta-carotene ketolase (CrtW type)